MCDFQCVSPNSTVAKKGVHEVMESLNTQEDNENETPAETQESIYLPPPIFSRVDIPAEYGYRPNPLFKVNEVTAQSQVIKSILLLVE